MIRNGASVTWGSERTAVFLPPGTTSGTSDLPVFARFDVKLEILRSIAAAMIGDECKVDQQIDFQTFRGLELIYGENDFLAVFRHYVAVSSIINREANRVGNIGLSETMLRSIVMLLAPHLFLNFEQIAKTPSEIVVSQLCEHIKENLTKKLTLPDLARLSGLSIRNLQYSFRSLTGLSPTQWINDAKLAAVRKELMTAKPGASVSAVASAYFNNLGDFSKYYCKRYGELPSQTLSCVRRQTR